MGLISLVKHPFIKRIMVYIECIFRVILDDSGRCKMRIDHQVSCALCITEEMANGCSGISKIWKYRWCLISYPPVYLTQLSSLSILCSFCPQSSHYKMVNWRLFGHYLRIMSSGGLLLSNFTRVSTPPSTQRCNSHVFNVHLFYTGVHVLYNRTR